ncbi:MAG: AmmeMemoRadiSam system radical SAM enzyme [Candidatus Omnitrophica bacterium]|nr:AmmeMemoRadiSam system radical SAM enzyme [Candidatus Omnitrophota bacterium]
MLSKGLGFVYASVREKEALYYKTLKDNSVQCLHCPHNCTVKDGKRGFCRIKENKKGKFFNIVYANPCAVHIDPIEKKPFFHFLPGSRSLSIATAGCNLRCKFCQNWQISQAAPEQVEAVYLSPEDIALKAVQTKSRSIAYTYTEPMVWYEFALDTAVIAKKNGTKNVMHTNGYVNPVPLRGICTHLNAINVDLKAFSEEYYSQVCSGSLKQILENLIIIKKEMGVWLELTNLIVPSLNDNPDQIRKMCEWIYKNLGPDVPVHFSRFFPIYKLSTLPPTPVSTLESAHKIAIDSGLKFSYIGNLPGNPAESTYCPKCKKELIKRAGYTIVKNVLNGSICPYCNESIAGVFV